MQLQDMATLKRRSVSLDETPVKNIPIWQSAVFSQCILAIASFSIFISFSGRRAIWDDEGVSVMLAYTSLHNFIHLIWGTELNMAFYYALLRIWLGIISILGIQPTEVIVRLPSVVFAVCTICGMYQLSRTFFNAIAAWGVSVLTIGSFYVIYYSGEARSYSLYMACAVWSYYILFRILSSNTYENNKKLNYLLWGLFVALNAIEINAHLIGLTFFLSQISLYCIYLFLPSKWQKSTKNNLSLFLLSCTGVFLLIIPILADAIRHHGNNNSIPVPTSWHDIIDFYKLALGYNQTLSSILFFLIMVGILSYALVSLYKNKFQPNFDPLFIGLLSWVFLPVLLAYVLSIKPFNIHLFTFRYQLGAYVAIFLLLSYLFIVFKFIWLRLLSMIILAIIGLYGIQQFNVTDFEQGYTPLYAFTGTNVALKWVETKYQKGDGVVCITATLDCTNIVAYYFDHAWSDLPARYGTNSPGGYNGSPQNGVNPISVQLLQSYNAQHRHVFVIIPKVGQAIIGPANLNERLAVFSSYKIIDRLEARNLTIIYYDVVR